MHANVYSLAQLRDDTPLGDHFALGEFVCHDDTPVVMVHQALILHLDRLREHFDAPIRVLSGFRTGAYNEKVGGANESAHLVGLAADIWVKGVPPGEVADEAESRGFGGVGRYDDFTHVDVRGRDRRWDRTGE